MYQFYEFQPNYLYDPLIFQVLEDNLNGLVITFVMMLIIMIFVIMTKEIVVALMLE